MRELVCSLLIPCAMKRPRPPAHDDGSAPFAFGFAVHGAGDDDAQSPAAAAADAAAADAAAWRARPLAGPHLRATHDAAAAVAAHADPHSALVLAAGSVCTVDWARSSVQRLRVTAALGGAVGDVPPALLRPLSTPRDAADATYAAMPSHACATAAVHDAVWAPAARLARAPHASAAPLMLEPGLGPLVWPLGAPEFLDRFYRRRALCVHAAGVRLDALRAELAGFDVRALVRGCERVVVWVRDAATGRMSYLESTPPQALACYGAGHSLYFNPPAAVQARYLLPLCAQLGMGAFGTTADGGIGGDVEVFAVRGRHTTPWHWDAQDNFTVQLVGSKRWSVAPSGVADPLTNLHASSAHAGSLAFDRRVHATHHAGYLQPPPDGGSSGGDGGGARPAADAASQQQARSAGDEAARRPGASPPSDGAGVVSFTLRPGSVLYTPAGMWHRVESESDEGSLHINLSLSGGGRWSDFLLKRLVPALWGADPGWRQRLCTGALAACVSEPPPMAAPLEQAHSGAAPAPFATGDAAAASSRGAAAATSSQAMNAQPPRQPAAASAAAAGAAAAAAPAPAHNGAHAGGAGAHPARAHASRLLASLRTLVSSLAPEDLLPDALLEAQLPDDAHGDGDGGGGRAGRRGARRQLAARTRQGDKARATLEGGDGEEAGDSEEDGAAPVYTPLLLAGPRAPPTLSLTRAQRRALAAGSDAGAGSAYAAAIDAWVVARGSGRAQAAQLQAGHPDDAQLPLLEFVKSPLVFLELPPALHRLVGSEGTRGCGASPVPPASAGRLGWEASAVGGHGLAAAAPAALAGDDATRGLHPPPAPEPFIEARVISGVLGRGPVSLGAQDGGTGVAPDYAVPLAVAPALARVLLAVASALPAARLAADGLLAACEQARSSAPGDGGADGEEGLPRAVGSLLRALCWTGALRMHTCAQPPVGGGRVHAVA